MSLNYNLSAVKSLENLKSTNINTYQINAYLSQNFGKYFLDSILGFAYNQYSTSQNIEAINATTKANYDGQSYLAKFEGGLVQKFKNGFDLTPKASLTFISNKVAQYNQSNAGAMNLAVKSNQTSFIEPRVGMDFGYNFANKKGLIINPKLKVSYGYEIMAGKKQNSANFINQPESSFQYQDFSPNRGSIKLGSAVDIYNIDSVAISAEYELNLKEQYQSHSALFKLRYEY